mgnify:CR=1 FL=1
MIRIINKNTGKDVAEVIDRDDLVVTNDLSDDTADIRVEMSDEKFAEASGYTLLK